MDISRSLSVCMCVWEGERARGCAIRIRERNRSQRAKRLPGSEEIRWLKLRLVSIFFSLSLSLFLSFPFLFRLIFLLLLPHFWRGGIRFERFETMDGSRERKKTSVEKRRKNDFKGFEKSISGRKIARRTLHDPYFFASIAWTS